ncbi:MAG TPA: single-stranded DNA-binding protein [Candidatus Nanoarchaeia archaeon]|nr:single-stranded DNA-binding protein [Candidatus Nanoarchaeia archaeon]
MYLNKAFVIGNLTRDPEAKALPSGIQVTSFSVATNRVWYDKNKQKQESADYHNIVVFGKQAENVAKYLKKGSSVLVEGRMQTRSWDGTDGQKKYRTEIIADRVQFGSRGGGEGSSAGAAAAKGGKSGKVDNVESIDTIEYPSEDINPEDIPF